MNPVVSKVPLMEWVHEKMSETKSLEIFNLLRELYEDFNLADVDPRSITPTDIMDMYEEMKLKELAIDISSEKYSPNIIDGDGSRI